MRKQQGTEAKVLKSKRMKQLLKKAVKEAKKYKQPKEGHMFPLTSTELKNGWDYQADYIYDLRQCDRPYVVVWGFKPPRVYYAKSAEYYLWKEL